MPSTGHRRVMRNAAGAIASAGPDHSLTELLLVVTAQGGSA
ncbi:hypothetical protein [Mycobacterium sp.]|nr:hypothetical protein [Mycobacterium sp.]HKP41790.1 hypothetical protein [Mycobacterium sp.]